MTNSLQIGISYENNSPGIRKASAPSQEEQSNHKQAWLRQMEMMQMSTWLNQPILPAPHAVSGMQSAGIGRRFFPVSQVANLISADRSGVNARSFNSDDGEDMQTLTSTDDGVHRSEPLSGSASNAAAEDKSGMRRMASAEKNEVIENAVNGPSAVTQNVARNQTAYGSWASLGGVNSSGSVVVDSSGSKGIFDSIAQSILNSSQTSKIIGISSLAFFSQYETLATEAENLSSRENDEESLGPRHDSLALSDTPVNRVSEGGLSLSGSSQMRVHSEWLDGAINIWIGADKDLQMDNNKWSQLAQRLISFCSEQGAQLVSITCNGKTILRREREDQTPETFRMIVNSSEARDTVKAENNLFELVQDETSKFFERKLT